MIPDDTWWLILTQWFIWGNKELQFSEKYGVYFVPWDLSQTVRVVRRTGLYLDSQGSLLVTHNDSMTQIGHTESEAHSAQSVNKMWVNECVNLFLDSASSVWNESMWLFGRLKSIAIQGMSCYDIFQNSLYAALRLKGISVLFWSVKTALKSLSTETKKKKGSFETLN